MTRARRIVVLALGVGGLAIAGGGIFVAARLWPRADRATPAALRAEIAALDAERKTLRARRAELMINDPRLRSMPNLPVNVGIPTNLARAFIEKIAAGFADRATIELTNIRVVAAGSVKKVVTLGDWNLAVTVNRVTARLKAGVPRSRFGGDAVAFDLPVTVAGGTGRATLNFKWNGRNISGVVCGDLDATQELRATVKTGTYVLSGDLALTATDTQVIIAPRFRPTKINLKIEPSDQAWAAVRKILDDKSGLCGAVLDRIDVMGALRRVIDKGFNVRLPIERIKPMALPVSIEPFINVRGRRVKLAITVGELSITEHAMWLGAKVSVTDTGTGAVAR